MIGNFGRLFGSRVSGAGQVFGTLFEDQFNPKEERDLVGDCTIVDNGGGSFTVTAPATVPHTVESTGPAVLYDTDDADFQIDMNVNAGAVPDDVYFGVLVEQDADNKFFYGLITSSGPSQSVVLTQVVDGVPSQLNLYSGSNVSNWDFQIIRTGTNYALKYKNSGPLYITSNVTSSINVTKTGFIAGNTLSSSSITATMTAYSITPTQAGRIDSRWTFVDPVGDCSVAETESGLLEIAVPATTTHDNYTGRLFSPRLLQKAPKGDFAIGCKIDSKPTTQYQFPGLIVQNSLTDFISIEISASPEKILVRDAVAGTVALPVNEANTLGAVNYLVITRVGDQWTLYWSTDDVTYTQKYQFTRSLTVKHVGVFAGNHNSTPPPPAFTAQFDYFSKELFDISELSSAMHAWWDFKDLATVTESGGSISQVDDKSGNSNHLIQGTGSLQPTVDTEGALHAGGQYFNLTTRLTNVRDSTHVLRWISPRSYAFILGDTTTYDHHGAASASLLFSVAYAPKLYGSTHYKNGVAIAGSVVTKDTAQHLLHLIPSSTTSVATVSYDRNISGREFTGVNTELVLWNRPLTTDERERVEWYMSNKHAGITLPPGHTYETTPPFRTL